MNVVWRIFEKAEIQYLTFEGRLKYGGEGLIVVKILYCSNESLNVEANTSLEYPTEPICKTTAPQADFQLAGKIFDEIENLLAV